tara:strand:+ start:1369 stop:1686 length:318 start_codon:yes stop_codon:yes gene_type:complete
MELDNITLIAEDWYLKKPEYIHAKKDDLSSRSSYIDLKERSQYFRVLGTERQLYDFFIYKLENDAWELRDKFDFDLQKSKSKDRYVNLYKENNNEVVLIKIISHE